MPQQLTIKYDGQSEIDALIRGNSLCTYDKFTKQAFDGKYNNATEFFEGTKEKINNFLKENK